MPPLRICRDPARNGRPMSRGPSAACRSRAWATISSGRLFPAPRAARIAVTIEDIGRKCDSLAKRAAEKHPRRRGCLARRGPWTPSPMLGVQLNAIVVEACGRVHDLPAQRLELQRIVSFQKRDKWKRIAALGRALALPPRPNQQNVRRRPQPRRLVRLQKNQCAPMEKKKGAPSASLRWWREYRPWSLRLFLLRRAADPGHEAAVDAHDLEVGRVDGGLMARIGGSPKKE